VLRFADLITDEELLIEAQWAARALVAVDPELTKPAQRRMRDLLESRYGERLEMFGVG
jgi:hypothetical protein